MSSDEVNPPRPRMPLPYPFAPDGPRLPEPPLSPAEREDDGHARAEAASVEAEDLDLEDDADPSDSRSDPELKPGDNRIMHLFPKEMRLLTSEDFQRVFDHGKLAADAILVVQAAANTVGRPRLGLILSRRVGSAVERNRWKRLIREAFRVCQHDLPKNADLVVKPRKDARAGFLRVRDSLMNLTIRLARQLNLTPPDRYFEPRGPRHDGPPRGFAPGSRPPGPGHRPGGRGFGGPRPDGPGRDRRPPGPPGGGPGPGRSPGGSGRPSGPGDRGPRGGGRPWQGGPGGNRPGPGGPRGPRPFGGPRPNGGPRFDGPRPHGPGDGGRPPGWEDRPRSQGPPDSERPS